MIIFAFLFSVYLYYKSVNKENIEIVTKKGWEI